MMFRLAHPALLALLAMVVAWLVWRLTRKPVGITFSMAGTLEKLSRGGQGLVGHIPLMLRTGCLVLLVLGLVLNFDSMIALVGSWGILAAIVFFLANGIDVGDTLRHNWIWGLVGAAALRLWVMSTLGERWSTRILILPESQPVDTGPFRHLRHPNYLAVVIEFAALPMVHTAYLTAVVFSAANAAVLARRIRVEEAGLAEHSDYFEVMGGKPRLIPGAK